MSLNETASANRIHIGIFGKRNSGKSSLINAITGQDIAIVSDVLGTTTDPVQKAMELLPLGPVVIIDTPGLDDVGELGQMRVKKAKDVLRKCDIAIIVCDASNGVTDFENDIINECKAREIPHIVVMNKCDIAENDLSYLHVSALENKNIDVLKEKISILTKSEERYVVRDLIKDKDFVILVTPIDESAPKGRIILPQQQVLRELLDAGAITIVVQPDELSVALKKVTPSLVITDSQVFGKVSKIVPENIPLTSFSILFVRKKGYLKQAIEGANHLDNLKDGDTVLISEGCTHHRQCNDIGTVKLPGWIKDYTDKDIYFEFTSGGEFPDDLSKYALIVHCGGCMLNDREVKYRMNLASQNGIPMTNYGITIAKIHGILDRCKDLFH